MKISNGNKNAICWGNEGFQKLSDMEFFLLVDLYRAWGWSWRTIDLAFGIADGRSRRLYRGVCANYGVQDVHRYKHCASY